jgi:hypothetical protein
MAVTGQIKSMAATAAAAVGSTIPSTEVGRLIPTAARQTSSAAPHAEILRAIAKTMRGSQEPLVTAPRAELGIPGQVPQPTIEAGTVQAEVIVQALPLATEAEIAVAAEGAAATASVAVLSLQARIQAVRMVLLADLQQAEAARGKAVLAVHRA